MKNLSYFDKNRISNIVWTITNKYGYDVDYSLIKEDYFAYDLLYNAVIIGSLYNILDYKMILEFVNHIRSKIKKNDEIINIFFMCIESTCVTKNTEFISNIKNIREKNYKEKIKSLNTGKNKDRLYNVLKIAYCSKYLSQNLLYPDNIKSLIDSIYEFEKVENTIEFIEKFKQIINLHFKFEEETAKQEDLSHKQLTKISEIRNNTQTIQEFFDNYTSSEFNPNESVIEKNFSTDSSTIDDKSKEKEVQDDFEKICQYYGRSIYGKQMLDIIEKKYAHGIHGGYKLFFTDGNIEGIKEDYRRSQIINEHEKNRLHYNIKRQRYEKSIEKIKSLIRQSLKFEEKMKIRSFSGDINAKKLYRAEKVRDYKVFNKEKRRDQAEFFIDIVLDSSASLLDRQEKLSVEAYIISRALEELKIKNSVTTFNSFIDYTVIKKLKTYENPDSEKCFEYFCSGGNRDGLAIDVIGSEEKDSDSNNLMILFTDARPFDVQVMHSIGTKAKKPYQGEMAIDDTASVVRKLKRKNTKMFIVFSGAEEDIKVLRYMYGSDFLYIVDIEQFSTKVGKLISDYISTFYE